MKPQQPSMVPAVVDAWLTLIRELTAVGEVLEGVQVIDGPPVMADNLKFDVVVIGRGTPEEPGMVSEIRRQEGLGRVSYVERVETTVIVSSYNGSSNMKARRDRAAELFASVKGVVDANQTREDCWDQAFLGPEVVWHPVQTEQGASCALGFLLVTESII